ncbi:hypothetical protein OS493_026528 [Desmophyllum pertusum]|uniref:Uncharacterized protein n=1 Tax=Desmophyllum pertusum TaxID=174260 RepID=A0A9W9YL05_9CNID|nr:hypothetical protein OS493_026528 [Desmophyllum pertusum]
MKFGLERTSNSRFGIRIIRKTTVKKLQSVDEEEFYGIASSDTGVSDKVDHSGKSAKRRTKRGKKAFRRNKVAPAPQKQGWKITGAKTPRAANKHREEDSYTQFSTILVEEDLEDGTLSSYGTTPLRMDSYNVVCSSTGLSSDPSVYDEEDMPGPSDNYLTHQVTLNLTDHAWEDTNKHTDKKSALANFLSKFKRGAKTTKVHKYRI